MTPAPIIFCHYGGVPYLKVTLAAAVVTNPERDVILLGDDRNAPIAREVGARFAPFADFTNGPLGSRFRHVYRLVQGATHEHRRLGEDWVRFVFMRWFVIDEYLTREGRQGAFWHFDSDTLLTGPLAATEASLADLDCTEGCGGGCLNGLVSSLELLKRFNAHTIALFEDSEYLARQASDFQEHPGWAFTEMRAYQAFRAAHGLRSERLCVRRNGTIFDECICFDDGFETEPGGDGRPLKRLWLRDGALWAQLRGSSERLRVWGVNLSWVPLEYFEAAWAHVSPSHASPPRIVGRATSLFLRASPHQTLVRRAESLRTVRTFTQRLRRLPGRLLKAAVGATGPRPDATGR